MNKLVEIEWIDSIEGPVPGYGCARKGARMEVPEHFAISFVYQGKAVYVNKKDAPKEVKEVKETKIAKRSK